MRYLIDITFLHFRSQIYNLYFFSQGGVVNLSHRLNVQNVSHFYSEVHRITRGNLYIFCNSVEFIV